MILTYHYPDQATIQTTPAADKLANFYSEIQNPFGTVNHCAADKRAVLEVTYSSKGGDVRQDMMALQLGIATRTPTMPPTVTVTVLRYVLNYERAMEGAFKNPEAQQLRFGEVSSGSSSERMVLLFGLTCVSQHVVVT